MKKEDTGGNQKVNYAQIVLFLQRYQGSWAKIGEFDYINNMPATLRQYGCEVTTRNNLKEHNGTFSIWARWSSGSRRVSPRIKTKAEHKEIDWGAIQQIIWEDPPPKRKSSDEFLDYDEVALFASQKPNTWFHIGEIERTRRVSVATSMRARGCVIATRATSRGDKLGVWVKGTQKPKTKLFSGPKKQKFVWGDPPPVLSANRKLPYERIVNELKQFPGCWGLIAVMPAGVTEGPRTTLKKYGVCVAVRRKPDDHDYVELWGMRPNDGNLKGGEPSNHPRYTQIILKWADSPPLKKVGRKARHVA